MRKSVLGAVLIAAVAIPAQASAFTVASHAGICDIVYQDIKQDRAVTFYRPKKITIKVSDDVYRAVTAGGGKYFRGGCMGPDMSPDTLTGQYYIHDDLSIEKKSHYKFHQWTARLLSRAWRTRRRDPASLGFALGFIGHGIGDGFMHHFVDSVNCNGGESALKRDPNCGAWNFSKGSGSYGKLTEEVKHLAVETYVNKHLFGKRIFTVGVPARFVVDNLVMDKVALRQYQGVMPTGKFYRMLLSWKGYAQKQARSKNRLVRWFFRGRAKATDKALLDWVTTWGNTMMGHLQRGHAHKIPSEISAWFSRNRHMFYPDVWPPALRALGRLLKAPFTLIAKAIKALIKLALKPLLTAVKEMASRAYYRWFDNKLFRDRGAMRKRLLRQMGNIKHGDRVGETNLERKAQFGPAHNAIVLTKIMLLDGVGLSKLTQALGLKIDVRRTSMPGAIMDGVMAKLDDSNQLWSTGPNKKRMPIFNKANWAAAKGLFAHRTSTYFLREWESNHNVRHPLKTGEQFSGNTSSIVSKLNPMRILNKILALLKNPGKAVVRWIKGAGQKILDAGKNLVNKGKRAVKRTGRKIRKAGKKARGAVKRTGRKIRNAGKKAKRAVKRTGSRIKKRAKKAKKWLKKWK